jgi:steroid 5-alpha reductase family enzyme
MTPIELAERVNKIMADEAMVEVFTGIRMGLVARLESLPVGDKDSQHEVALMLQLLKQVRVQMETYGREAILVAHDKRNEAFIRKIKQSTVP